MPLIFVKNIFSLSYWMLRTWDLLFKMIVSEAASSILAFFSLLKTVIIHAFIWKWQRYVSD